MKRTLGELEEEVGENEWRAEILARLDRIVALLQKLVKEGAITIEYSANIEGTTVTGGQHGDSR